MATIDPTSALNAAVSSENAVQVITALQSELLRLNNVLNQFTIDLSSQMSSNKLAVDFEGMSLQGEVKGIRDTVNMLNDNIKD